MLKRFRDSEIPLAIRLLSVVPLFASLMSMAIFGYLAVKSNSLPTPPKLLITNDKAPLSPLYEYKSIENIAALLSLVCSFLATLGTLTVLGFASEAELRRRDTQQLMVEIGELGKDLDRLGNVKLITGDAAYKQLAKSLSEAATVNNTYVGLFEETGSSKSRGAEVGQLYKTLLLRKDTKWDDIVGVGDFLDGRYDKLVQSLDTKCRGVLTVTVINTHAPILNFIMCSPASATRPDEVYFGWVADHGSTEIFYSNHATVISLFETYYRLLKTRSLIVDDTQPIDFKAESGQFPSSNAKRFRGDWVTIEGRGLIQAGQQVVPSVEKYTILKIGYNRDWWVRGETRSLDGKGSIEQFHSIMCVVIGRRLYFSYKIGADVAPTDEPDGIATYTFDSSGKGLIGKFSRIKTDLSDTVRAVRNESGEALDESARKRSSPILAGLIQRALAIPLT